MKPLYKGFLIAVLQLVTVSSLGVKLLYDRAHRRDNSLLAVINGETAYFLPEHKNGPILRNRGEELWIEATIPRKGPPRPIRLGIKKNGVLTPLSAD